jgi:drug/metabolite transporter (DMT)-like permease
LSSTGVVLVASAAVGWALYDLARRALSARLAAWALLTALTALAVPPLLAWALWAGDWRIAAPYWPAGVASVLLNVAANFCYFRAFQLAPLSVTLPMLSFTPLFASLLGAALLGEALGPREVFGAMLVVAGGLALGMREGGTRFETGSVLMLVVAFLWSATLLLDKRAIAHASPYVHALVLNAGVAVAGLAALAFGRRWSDLAPALAVLPRLALAVAIGASALTVQLLALRDVSLGVVETTKRGIGGFSAVAFGALLYDERITARKVVAVAVMTLGVALILL